MADAAPSMQSFELPAFDLTGSQQDFPPAGHDESMEVKSFGGSSGGPSVPMRPAIGAMIATLVGIIIVSLWASGAFGGGAAAGAVVICTAQQNSSGCTTCQEGNYCTGCSEGFEPSGGACEWYCSSNQKSQGCTECANSKKCTACVADKLLAHATCAFKCSPEETQNQCVACSEDDRNKCVHCQKGFEVRDGKCAVACDQSQNGLGCARCSSSTNCTACKEGYTKDEILAVPSTRDTSGRSITGSNQTQTIDSCTYPCSMSEALVGCTKCVNETYCSQCAEGYDAKDGLCDWHCSQEQTDQGCSECEHATKCLACAQDGASLVDGKCVYYCKPEQVQNNCKTCNWDGGSNSLECIECQEGYLIKDKKCVMACFATGEGDVAPDLGLEPEVRNGFEYPAMCVAEEVGKFFVLGDWGGAWGGGRYLSGPAGSGAAADNSGSRYAYNSNGLDERAQKVVADQMNARARQRKPRFVVNVGDAFYWGGFEEVPCGKDPKFAWSGWANGRWKQCFEDMYDLPHPTVPGQQIPFMGVQGNHDWGGRSVGTGWDVQVYYTYKPGIDGSANRWRMPGLWWSQKVHFETFSLELWFLDGNYLDAKPLGVDPNHNICNSKLPGTDGSCKGPGYDFFDTHSCSRWHAKNWRDQMQWLREGLENSKAHYTGLVAHYINNFDGPDMSGMIKHYGVDIVMAGHSHYQVVGQGNGCSPEAPCGDQPIRIISGGGGGITSEAKANEYNGMYGFMDVEMTATHLTAFTVNWAGKELNRWKLQRRKKVKRGEI